MEVCKELINLAKEFNKENATLYIVGGYVRDYLMGLNGSDIDITSSLDQDKVVQICNRLKIKTHNINKTLGTIQMTCKDNTFEYTRFRKESYSIAGKHTPDKVEFVDDIAIDTLRRDYTINSIYYDILKEEFIDLSGGREDIEKILLRTTNKPTVTLKDDALRILRGVRLSSTFDLNFEKNTLKALKTYTPLLKNISKERILREISLSVVADLKYGKENSNFLTLCNTLYLPKYIFNSTLSNIKKFNKSDMEKFYALSKDSRLIAFYILILKNYFNSYQSDNHLAFAVTTLLGTSGIRESNQNIVVTEKIYRIYQNLEYSKDVINATVNYLTLSNAEREIVDTYLGKKAKTQLSDNISAIKDNNLPLNVHQLDICAEDLIDIGIDKKFISKILSTLYNQVLNMRVKNSKGDLKSLARELNETFTKIAKEIL